MENLVYCEKSEVGIRNGRMKSARPPEKSPGPVEELRRQLAALKAEVTSQKWLLDALESQSAQYRALFELMPGSVLLMDAKGFIRDANPYFCKAMGYSREELVGQHVTRISRERTEVIERNILRMISGETLQHEVTNVQKDGTLRFYELRETAVTLPDGSMNILTVANDITDRRGADRARQENSGTRTGVGHAVTVSAPDKNVGPAPKVGHP